MQCLALKSLLCWESNLGPLAFCAGMLTTTPQDRAIEIKHANGPHSGMQLNNIWLLKTNDINMENIMVGFASLQGQPPRPATVMMQ